MLAAEDRQNNYTIYVVPSYIGQPIRVIYEHRSERER